MDMVYLGIATATLLIGLGIGYLVGKRGHGGSVTTAASQTPRRRIGSTCGEYAPNVDISTTGLPPVPKRN